MPEWHLVSGHTNTHTHTYILSLSLSLSVTQLIGNSPQLAFLLSSTDTDTHLLVLIAEDKGHRLSYY